VSLIKQLWIAIALLVCLMFVSSFGLSFMAAKQYFEEQLSLKNMDNASSLALTLSQIEKDPALLETFVSAQFDMGHYLRITLHATDGEPLVLRESQAEQVQGVPDWFVHLFALDVQPGAALVSSGWQSFGRLSVESHQGYAYEALWRSAWQLCVWMLALALLSSLVGSLLLKRIIRPLDTVILQAEAIGEQRFLTAGEPRTREFGLLVRAMNSLSLKVKNILDIEARRLEKLRYELEHDSLTGLSNRSFFLSQFDAVLSGADRQAQHGLFLFRIEDLGGLNSQLGHAGCDRLICALADAVQDRIAGLAGHYRERYFGRLNGSDFALVLTEVSDLPMLSEQLLQRLEQLAAATDQAKPVLLQAGCSFYSGESRASVMMRADSVLARAEQQGQTHAELETRSEIEALTFVTAEDWREALLAALQDGVAIQAYPVMSNKGEVLHHEAMMRLKLAGSLRSAGYFIPWARRLGLQPDLDLALLEHVLTGLADARLQGDIAINLSPEIILDAPRLQRMEQLLRRHAQQATHVWLECQERVALQHPEAIALFVERMRSTGCRIGLDSAGAAFMQSAALHDVGLNYLKVDAVYAQRLQDDSGAANYLQRLCSLGHSIGLTLVLEGVQNAQVVERAWDCGLDAVTGPGVQSPV